MIVDFPYYTRARVILRYTSREGTTWGIYIDIPHCDLSVKGGYMDILPMLYSGTYRRIGSIILRRILHEEAKTLISRILIVVF